MRGGATVRHYVNMFIALGFPLLIFIYFYAYNKIAEGAWFYVVPHIWAWIMRRPFCATLHKMTWKWWHPAFDEGHYVSCLVMALFYGSLLYVIVALVQEEVTSRWALVKKGSGDSWPHLPWLGRILLEQLVWLFALLPLVSFVWEYGECFLVAVTHGTNHREKAIICVAAVATMVATMVALYFLPSPLALIP
jgi:hypothetical protein